MKNKKTLLLLAIPLAASVLAACGPSGSSGSDLFDSIPDGSAYTEIDDEEVDEITIFKNDWESFNTARTTRSPIYTKIKNKIGCDIIAQNSSAANWETQEYLLQASDSLPDIFITNGADNSSMFSSFIENGDLLPISDWVSEEHYPNIYNYIQQFSYMRTNISYAYGKLWYIPSTWHNEKSLYVRTDWIRNLNAKLGKILVAEGIIANESALTPELTEQYQYKIPENLLDFYRLARAFTIYSPNSATTLRDGKTTYGYFSESNKDMDAWLYVAMDAGWSQFIEGSTPGTYVNSDTCDGAKAATAIIARMIAEGYMSIDSLNADMDGKQNKIMTGHSGMIFAHNWYSNMASGMMENFNWTAEQVKENLAMVEPPAGPNGKHGAGGQDASWQGFCINGRMSNAKIRKCLELYDYLLSDEGYNLLQYGIEGVHYTTNEDGSFKESLIPVDQVTGLRTSLPYYDEAAFLYALVEWTMHYKSLAQNFADVVVPRHKIAEKNSSFSDYPCLTTDAYLEYYEDAHDYFLAQILKMEKDEIGAFGGQDENINWSTFGWDDLLDIPAAFNNKWKSMKNTYNGTYHGTEIIDSINERIASGDVVKVDPNSYIYR